jgi:hypothetical protein
MRLPPIKRLRIGPRIAEQSGDTHPYLWAYELSVDLDRGEPFRLQELKVAVTVPLRIHRELVRPTDILITVVQFRIAEPGFEVTSNLAIDLEVDDDDLPFLLAIDPERSAAMLGRWIALETAR